MMGEVIRVSGKTPDVGEFLREAMLSQRFADVALCCPGGQRFLAHRLVLSAASPYLQEVLLAHSKTSSQCEPITVILAEVEAPELAAILGFVYTGSAKVPRPRLEAFLRAAAALRIRLPPIPVVMTCTEEADCKQEDVKDVKISPKYLQCEQYPTCDRWYRPGRNTLDEDHPARKKESYLGSERFDVIGDVAPHPEPINFVGARYNSGLYSTRTWPVPAYAGIAEPGSRIEEPLDRRNRLLDVRNYHPASVVPRTDLAKRLPGFEGSAKLYRQIETRGSLDPNDSRAALDPLELRLKADFGPFKEANYARLLGEDETTERGGTTTTNENCFDVERIREDRVVLSTSFQSRTESLQYTARSRSFEKPDYGEDLTCEETCCRWRTPKRHVANSVTASPWRQIVRPHHSPKLRPIVLRPRSDETETVENVRVPETKRPIATSSSPNHQSPKTPSSSGNFYNFDVPTVCETSYSTARRVESTSNSETRLQEFYSPTISYATPAESIPPVAVRSNETFFGAQTSTDNAELSNNNSKKTGYFGQTLPTQKPELSHPISRLCDTVESTAKKGDEDLLELKRPKEETQRNDEKITGRFFVNSDSNNNDSIVGNDTTQRGRSTGLQEDHRCDQCGKTFVTRASLKVHARTHSGEKPFRCADCGKQFSQLRNYKYHRSVHEGTREFAATCPECGKYFNDRGYLSSHMKIHRNRKEYGCAECGKSFNQRVAYNMHVRIHTGVKPHQCEQCGKAFSRKMLLKQHLRTHSGERPYQCQVCQKAFADRSNMTLHTRLHSGLKPYQCTLCTKAFTKKHHLKTHLNYHTGTKPYSCPNCGLRFSQSSNMRTHFKKCAVNNPAGFKTGQIEDVAKVESRTVEGQTISRTSTDALTPPNSDQESSILTPLSKSNVVDANIA